MPQAEGLERTFMGRTLYAPGVIAAYTILANLPIGFILYGLNLRARGQRAWSLVMLWLAGVSIALVVLLALTESLPPVTPLIGVVGAINVYQIEKRPFEQALRRGAQRARWWPPAVFLLAGLGVVVLVQFLAAA
jgi:hypothetical protein